MVLFKHPFCFIFLTIESLDFLHKNKFFSKFNCSLVFTFLTLAGNVFSFFIDIFLFSIESMISKRVMS